MTTSSNLPTFRTDRNNNPTAFITLLAQEAGLVLGTDYTQGDPFTVGTETFYTAKLLGDPIAITIKVIDKCGFFTPTGQVRWTYITLEYALWKELSSNQKKMIIGIMYMAEGGTTMKGLFV